MYFRSCSDLLSFGVPSTSVGSTACSVCGLLMSCSCVSLKSGNSSTGGCVPTDTTIKTQPSRRVKRRVTDVFRPRVTRCVATRSTGFDPGRCASRRVPSDRVGAGVRFVDLGRRKRTVVPISRGVHHELDDAFRVYGGSTCPGPHSAARHCGFFFSASAWARTVVPLWGT